MTAESIHTRTAFGLLIALAAFRHGHEIVKLALQAQQIDFGAYYVSTAALWSGLDPYNVDWVHRAPTVVGILRAQSPPTFAPAGYLVFLPFVFLQYPLARLAWLLIGQVCLAIALVALYRRLLPPPVLAATGLLVALGYQPIYEDAAVGNLNLVMLLLVTFALVCWSPTHALRAALPLSLAVNLKPHYGVLIPFLWWLGARKAAWLTLGLALGWSGIALLVFETTWLPEYVRFFTVHSASLHSWTRNLSPHALLHRLFSVDGPHIPVDGAAVVVALAVAAAVLWTLRQKRSDDDGHMRAMAMAVSALPLVSPLLEEHHLVVLLLPLLFVLARADRLHGARDVICLVGAVVLLASRYSLEAFPVFNRGLPSLAYAGKALGAALLVTVIARLKERAPGD